MAEQVSLATRLRAGSGKGEARALRRQGRVPAIAYGVGIEPTPISVDARALYHVLHTDAGLNAVIALDVEGTTHLAVPRELNRHPVRREVVHLDFVTVSRTVKVAAQVPITLIGEAAGAADGGVVDQQLNVLDVEVLPLEMPDAIELDITTMAVGDVRRVSDLRVAAGIDVMSDPDVAIVTLAVPGLDLGEAPVTVEPADDAAEAGDEAAPEAAPEA